jgi:histidinol-phosphate aminotransferase
MSRALTHIADMSPYALAQMDVPARKKLISLAQNECLRPPSPIALQAAARALENTHLYPDPDWTDLRDALAAHHGLDADTILCGNGSLDLIGCITRVFAGPDRAVLAPAHAYPFFKTATQMSDARFDIAQEISGVVSVDTLLAAVRRDTGVVFVANPGNPTGTRISRAELLRLRVGLADDVLLVIDEAYGEFADHLQEASFDFVERGNTAVLRTFSKAYGMAGHRVGWGVFPPEIAVELRKVMNPNNVSAVAQITAIGALQDQAYMRETCAMTIKLRDTASKTLREAGFKVAPSYTNFLTIDFGTAEAAQTADLALQSEGVFLRRQTSVGLPQILRMTIGSKDAVNAAIALLTNWKKESSL